MKWNLAILLLFMGNFSFAQFIVEGTIIDAFNNLPIENANIQLKGQEKGSTSNEFGKFSLEIESLPVSLLISHIGFETEEYLIEVQSEEEVFIFLFPEVNVLDEITVIPKDQIKSLSDVDEYSINHFEISDDKIYCLEFYGTFKKYNLRIKNLSGDVISSLKLNDIKGLSGLSKSCNNNVYLLTSSKAVAIKNVDAQIDLRSSIQLDTFKQLVQTCKLINNKKLYYINEFHNGLSSEVSMYDIDKDLLKTMRSISNKEQVSNYKKDRQFIDRSESIGNIETNNVGKNEAIRNLQEDGDFLSKIFYKPEHPIFIGAQNDGIIIFNHIESKLEIYRDDVLVSEVDIVYPKDKRWLKKIIFDEITQKAYGIFDFKGRIGIKEIIVENGKTKLVAVLKTSIQNSKSIRVYNGLVFYLKNEGSRMELLSYEL